MDSRLLALYKIVQDLGYGYAICKNNANDDWTLYKDGKKLGACKYAYGADEDRVIVNVDGKQDVRWMKIVL